MNSSPPNDKLYQLIVNRIKAFTRADIPSRRLFIGLVSGACIIGALLVAGIELIFSELYLSAIACLVTSLLTFAVMYSGYRFKTENLLAYSICLIYSGVCLFAMLVGGVGNSGLFWSFVVPMLVYPMLGISIGTIYLLIHAYISLHILYFEPLLSWAAQYPTDTKIRFIVTLLVITMISFFKEISRKFSIEELKATSSKLETLARTDELTRLLNRRAMREKLQYEMSRADRGNTPLSLILCDIDFFKNVNDKFGHDIGDEVLKVVAQTIKETLRKPDYASRWGGEEFLILLPMTDESGAYVMAERLRKAIAALAIPSDQGEVTITMSCGLASKTDHTPLDEMIKVSDINLYRAKDSGRNKTFPQVPSN